MPLKYKDETKVICEFDDKINNILNIAIPKGTEIRCSDGLITHLQKRNHEQCIKHISNLKEIISSADYVGQGAKKNLHGFELVKKLDGNILVAIQFDIKNGYLYVASLYPISNAKLTNRINSGRLKNYQQNI